MTNFETTLRKGFRMTFSNGLTVSVQWGYDNLCDNQNKYPDDWDFDAPVSCKNAGVKVFDTDGEEMDLAYVIDTQYGYGNYEYPYCTPEQVAQILYHVSQF